MADIEAVQAAVREYARTRTETLAETFVETVQGFAPRRTGALADSVSVDSISESSAGFSARIVVESDYAVFVNFGTGLYGPSGAMIVVGPPEVMVFDGIGGTVFTHRSRGSEPTHFWERAVDQWPAIVGAA